MSTDADVAVVRLVTLAVIAAVPPRTTDADATRAPVVKLESSACADPPVLIGRLATPSTRTAHKATRDKVSFMPLSDLCLIKSSARTHPRRPEAVSRYGSRTQTSTAWRFQFVTRLATRARPPEN